MALDIDERHLLRLGHGEEELQTEKDFSRSDSGLRARLSLNIIIHILSERHVHACIGLYIV